MKTYEAMLLLDNREVKKGWAPLKEQVDAVLRKNGAEIVVAKRWDERKLAFEIKKQRRATYYLAYLKADPESVSTIRHALALTGPVLRHLILTCEEVPSEAYEPEREFEIDKPDPEETTDTAKDGGAKDGGAKDGGAEGGADVASDALAADGGTGAEATESGDSTPAATESDDAVATDAVATDAEATDAVATDAEATDAEATDAEATDAEATDGESTGDDATTDKEGE